MTYVRLNTAAHAFLITLAVLIAGAAACDRPPEPEPTIETRCP